MCQRYCACPVQKSRGRQASACSLPCDPGTLQLEDRITARSIPELLDLDRLAETLVGRASLETLCTVHWQDVALPVRALTLGAVEPE